MINRPFKFSEPKKPSIWSEIIGMVLWLGFWLTIFVLAIYSI